MRPDVVDISRIIRAGFATRSIGVWPTPLESCGGLAEVLGLDALWLKREDRSSPLYGGNKVRGLEFLLAHAPADAVCVTVGGTGSTHCLATALHGRALGLRVALAQFPQPPSDACRAVGAAAERAADIVVRAGARATFPLALARAWYAAGRLGRRWWIPGGGAHPRAVLGHVLAALELAQQLDRAPDALLVPLGTGGTAAGLALGVALLGWPSEVVAVRVAPRIVANGWRVALLGRQAGGLLAAAGGPRVRGALRVRVVDGVGRGYGHPTRAGEIARARAAALGVTVDSTYGAKTLAAVAAPSARQHRRVVFWHTFSAPPGLVGGPGAEGVV